MRKYELTGWTRNYGINTTLHRIRALRDLPRCGVKEGDIGGWVESENNLTQNGDAWIGGDAQVYGPAQIYGNAQIYGKARIGDDACIGGSAHVGGNALVGGNARIDGSAQIYGYARIYGDAWINSDALIDSSACLLTATIFTSKALYATAFYQKDGSWRARVNCWAGSIPELREMAEYGKWVDTPPEAIEEARPELLAFVALCEARAARVARTAL